MKLKFTHFPVIKNTIKRIAFRNTYETSIIFQSFYLPAFLPNLRLMRPLSIVIIDTTQCQNTLYKLDQIHFV